VPTVPSDAHFFMARLEPGAPARLRAAGILIKDLSATVPGFARISVATALEAALFEQAYLGDSR